MERRIEIYTGDNCGNCKALKEYCQQAGIEFIEKPISDKDNMMFLRKNGLMGVPVLALSENGNTTLASGFGGAVELLKKL